MRIIVVILFLLFILTACFDIGFNNDIDKNVSQELIDKFEKTGEVDSVLLENANIERIIPNGNYYLCINNGFSGDFNGLVFSKNGKPVPDTIRFDRFYIKSIDGIDGKWTEVAGSC